MPDIPHKLASGETVYRHITSGQAKIMRDQKWQRIVAKAKREKAEREAAEAQTKAEADALIKFVEGR